MQHLCEDSVFSDLGKFWKISKVKIHMQFFSISCKLEFIFFIRIKKKKNLKDRYFRKENSFFRFENCGKFWKMQCSNIFHSLGRVCVQIFSSISHKLRKNSSPPKNYFTQKGSLPKKVLPRKIRLPRKLCFHQKKCLSLKTCLSRKMFHLKKLTNPKKLLRECNIYVKILYFLTSENFGKFLR